MLFLLGLIISVLLALTLLYIMFMQSSPELILDLGFINFLVDNPGAAIGGLIGMVALTFTVILPVLASIPTNIKEIVEQRKLSSNPIKVIGQVLTLTRGSTHSSLELIYAMHKKTFQIDNRVLSPSIERGQRLTVFYDPKNKDNAYVDIVGSLEQENSSTKKSDTLFKLLEITPKFDVGPTSFELIGELYGDVFEQQKVSLICQLPRDEISRYAPGTLFPCVVSGSKANYTISIS